MHFLGGQKKLRIFGGRPWRAKLFILHCKMHFFRINPEKNLNFWKRYAKNMHFTVCKIKIFASQGQMRIFFAYFSLSPQKCIFFWPPPKMHNDWFRFLAFAPIFFKKFQNVKDFLIFSNVLQNMLNIWRISSFFLHCLQKSNWTSQGFLPKWLKTSMISFFSWVFFKKQLKISRISFNIVEHFDVFLGCLQCSSKNPDFLKVWRSSAFFLQCS